MKSFIKWDIGEPVPRTLGVYKKRAALFIIREEL